MLFNVYFDERSAIPVDQPNEELAKRLARLQVWVLTGIWMAVLKVEHLAGSMHTHLTEAS